MTQDFQWITLFDRLHRFERIFPVQRAAAERERRERWTLSWSKMSADLSTMLFGTYLGGNRRWTAGNAIAGRFLRVPSVVAGQTSSGNFPLAASNAGPIQGEVLSSFVTNDRAFIHGRGGVRGRRDCRP